MDCMGSWLPLGSLELSPESVVECRRASLEREKGLPELKILLKYYSVQLTSQSARSRSCENYQILKH